MKVLITGGCGFIGHHLVEHILKNTDWEIMIFDKLSYAANGMTRLRDIQAFDDKRVRVFTVNLTQPLGDGVLKEVGDVDYIFHLAGETHVDRSIDDPEPFVMNNVVGTMHLLNFAKKIPSLKKFHFMSTDEVFGPAPGMMRYSEWARYNSGNPYAATKAGAEELCLAYQNTYKMPIFITHTMNVFGERQHAEKFIPLCIRKILAGDTISIHSNAEKTMAGSRFWIHGRNVAAALQFLVDKAADGEKYNIVGEKEVDNLEIAKLVGAVLDKPVHWEMVDFHSSRPGHDLRYGLDGQRMQEMGWEHPKNFMDSLEKTVLWYVNNPSWLSV